MRASTDICNAALAYLGADPVITMDDGSKESRLCRQFYDNSRKALLRTAPWSFALRSKQLARDSEENKFRLPINCLYVARVSTPNYMIAENFIITDEKAVTITYVEDLEDVTKMDSIFCELLAYRLAKEICFSLTADLNLQQLLEQKYTKLEAEARFRMSSEQRAQEIAESPWIIARY